MAAVAASFPCDACATSFATRNGLFRHLRTAASCAASGGLAAKLLRDGETPKAAAVPAVQIHAHAVGAAGAEKKRQEKGSDAVRKTDGKENKEQQHLNLETRPESYEAELAAKVAKAQAMLDGCGGQGQVAPRLEVFASPKEHFRMRAEFDVWKTEEGPSYIMHDGKAKVVVHRYPMAARLICDTLMPTLLQTLREVAVLRERLFQVNFHATLQGDGLVSLLYNSPFDRVARRLRCEHQQAEKLAEVAAELPTEGPLSPAWEVAAATLQSALGASVSVVGHTRGKKCVLGRDWVQEQLEVRGAAAPLRYRQLEGMFSQPNALVAQHMLAWARAVASGDDVAVGALGPRRSDDLLELYCGNGNFAVALAPLFRRVLATELVKALVDAAMINAEENGVDNAAFARLSAEELAQALEGARTFQRAAHIDLTTYDLSTALVDPPRAGLGPFVCSFLARFQRIVYVSCNPVTLRQDLDVLSETHDVKRLAAFDQFPYTDHLEMGALLVRRT